MARPEGARLVLSLLRRPLDLLAVAVALLVGIVLHGVVQAVVAARLGDRMPQATGRTSLDPRRHFDVFGIIAMLIAGIGWGRPVPLQEPRFRRERPRFALAVLSGPVTNLVIALVALVGLRLVGDWSADEIFQRQTNPALTFLGHMAGVNAALAVLTLIPLPPLDGARLLWMLMPATEGWRKARYYLEEQNFGIGICLVLILPLFGPPGLLDRIVTDIAGTILDGVGSLLGM